MLISDASMPPYFARQPKLIADLGRRSTIEPEIGHKTDERLARCTLKGSIGGAVLSALCACRQNVRKTLTGGVL